MSTKLDLRSIKTKQQIFQAFISLLEQESFDTITVSKITEKALISRSTFYDHYSDKHDLLDALYIKIQTELKLQLTLLAIQDADHIEPGRLILSYVLEHARIFRVLLSENIPSDKLYHSLKDALEPACMQYLSTHPNKYNLDSTFIFQIYLTLIYHSLQWVSKNENPEDFQKLLSLSYDIQNMFFETKKND